MSQKFPIYTQVRIKDSLPDGKTHVLAGGDAIVCCSYAQKHGSPPGQDADIYALWLVQDGKVAGVSAWYPEIALAPAEEQDAVRAALLVDAYRQTAIKAPTIYASDDLDQEYMKAVELGNMTRMEALVAHAAQRGGYTIGPVFRAQGSKRGSMTDAISGGIYFFNKAAPAILWAGDTGTVSSAYLKPRVVKDVHEHEGCLTRGIPGIDPRTGLEGRDADTIIRRFPDSSDIAEIVVFDPEQIRSADLIVRDSNGAVVPLSRRFGSAPIPVMVIPAALQHLDALVLQEIWRDHASLREQYDTSHRSVVLKDPDHHVGRNDRVTKPITEPTGTTKALTTVWEPDVQHTTLHRMSTPACYYEIQVTTDIQHGVTRMLLRYAGNRPVYATPDEFLDRDSAPIARTVGELAELLTRLSPDMPIQQGDMNAPVKLMINHTGERYCHLALLRPGE